MGTVNGLPAHILLVHAIVVLLPLAAVLLVLTAWWPAARRRLAGPNVLLSAATLVLVPITMDAGQWLQDRVPDTPLLQDHTQLGDTALYAAFAVTVMALVTWWRHREALRVSGVPSGAKRTFLAPRNTGVTVVVGVVASLIAGAALYDVYLIGDSGARASWTGDYSATVIEDNAD
ncbi:hypothetical protein [Actinoplanes sp. NPDC089786]|uniref:hypothetical protein n=1 Tax=Actinoplanes sp. NPDC089786 TaxID=3155185 RepID=UPI00342788C1